LPLKLDPAANPFVVGGVVLTGGCVVTGGVVTGGVLAGGELVTGGSLETPEGGFGCEVNVGGPLLLDNGMPPNSCTI
jgi:hypothetical protein